MRMVMMAWTLLLLAACGGSGEAPATPAPGTSAPAGLSYPAAAPLVVAHTMVPLSPTVTGTVASYSVAPALPAGLALNATTGVISGTPAVASPATTYVITASNAGGSAKCLPASGYAILSRWPAT